MILAFTEAFMLVVYAYLLVKWLVIGAGIAGILWVFYKAGEARLFNE
jgi:hypothetical protein